MASNRHLGRIVALQSLYEWEFRDAAHDPDIDVDEIIARNLEQYKQAIDDTGFVKGVVQGVVDARATLDEKIQPIAPEWPLEQISRVDLCILRLGVYELTQSKHSVPPKVAINEAVELAKAFGSDNSSKFVNGVLGTAYRTLVEGESDHGSTKV